MGSVEEETPTVSPDQGATGEIATSIPQVDTVNLWYSMGYFGPILKIMTVFHIEKNGEVKLGLPSNLEQFEGEVIRPLPCDMYPDKLFSSDLI